MTEASQVIPELLVEDIPRSADFYGRLLGLGLDILYEVEGRPQYARLGDAGFTVVLNRQPGRGDLASRMPLAKLWFVIRGIDDLHSRLQSDGMEVGKIVRTDYGTKEFMVNDPDGYRIGVQERLGQD